MGMVGAISNVTNSWVVDNFGVRKDAGEIGECMLTQTHMLVGAAAATRPTMKAWMICLGFLGGLLPDLSTFVMFAYATATGVRGAAVWSEQGGMYWSEPWQTLDAISNSMPLWLFLALCGLLVWRAARGRWQSVGLALAVFAFAALFHTFLDFPVHTDDAHVHFWPFTDWRFHSPISYYQRAHFGGIVRWIDMGIGLFCAGWIVWRYKQWMIKLIAIVLAVPYFISLHYFF